MRVSISLICLVLALVPGLCFATSMHSEPELQPLNDSLSLIDEGLQMIESPLSGIESQQQQREQRLNEIALDLQGTAQDLTQRDLRAQETEERLNSRELALSARAKVLDWRESGLLDNWLLLNKMERKIRRARVWGVIVMVGAFALGSAAGYAIGHF